MKSKLILSMMLVLIAAACGGRSRAGNAVQQNYETVEEGSASGVTSTIQGPGEALPPITETSADTTTAFALDPNALPPPQDSPPRPEPEPQPEPERAEPQPMEPTPTNTDTTATTNTDTTATNAEPTNEKPPP